MNQTGQNSMSPFHLCSVLQTLSGFCLWGSGASSHKQKNTKKAEEENWYLHHNDNKISSHFIWRDEEMVSSRMHMLKGLRWALTSACDWTVSMGTQDTVSAFQLAENEITSSRWQHPKPDFLTLVVLERHPQADRGSENTQWLRCW